MSDIKLFNIHSGLVSEMAGSAAQIERDLQTLFERNLETLLGIRFIASEFSTGPVHGGRIDTLGLDEDGCPIIIEFKRSTNENVINQGLYYLHWLMDHKGDFERLVHRMLGPEDVEKIDWSNPRLLCIAGDFTRYDEHAVKQINRNIELLRYRRFGDQTLLLDVVHAPKIVRSIPPILGLAFESGNDVSTHIDPYQSQRIDDRLANAPLETRGVFNAARDYLVRLGEDVRVKELKCYIAFKRVKNFACVEVHPKARIVTAYLKLDPETISIEPGFTRDVRRIGHFGTGELEVSMKSLADLARAQPLMRTAYDRSCIDYESPWTWEGVPSWPEPQPSAS
jgi:predicted transport protein